jgi:hypothetical protein
LTVLLACEQLKRYIKTAFSLEIFPSNTPLLYIKLQLLVSLPSPPTQKLLSHLENPQIKMKHIFMLLITFVAIAGLCGHGVDSKPVPTPMDNRGKG